MSKNTFKKALSMALLTGAVSFTACQQEELMENQFTQETPSFSSSTVKPIQGQYIVVMKPKGKELTATRVGALTAADRQEIKSKRLSLLTELRVDNADVKEVYEGTVNGFAAKLNDEQIEALRRDPNVASIEQDYFITLGKPTRDYTSPSKGNGGKKTKEPVAEPTPTPTEPAPEPTPEPVTEPEPTPTPEPEPTPAPSTGAYTTITPKAGELVPWNIARVGYGDGTGRTAWIIDSGIDTDHPDLNIDLSRSASFVYGLTSVEDGYGHGTAVAGIIAAKNNGTGMIGVASGATVVALRVFDDAGAGTMSRAISAVNHVINVASAGDVVNMSLGGGISSTLDNAVKTAAAKGILFAIASGNSATDCINNSPARVDAPNVYTVSAMDRYDRFGSFSNYGTPVDFTAPGVSVTSTSNNGGLTNSASGTSFAAPHVAGILLLQGTINTNGIVTGDVDANPDPIAVLK